MKMMSEYGERVYGEFIRRKVELEYVCFVFWFLASMLINALLKAKNILIFLPPSLLLRLFTSHLNPHHPQIPRHLMMLMIIPPPFPLVHSIPQKLLTYLAFRSRKRSLPNINFILNCFRTRLLFPSMKMIKIKKKEKSFVFRCLLLLQIKREFFTWFMLMRVLKRWLLLASICLTFFVHQSGFKLITKI